MANRPEPDLAGVAQLVGDRARGAMLAALLGGEWLPAGELAARAGVARSTASEHLARLVEHGLVTRRVSGRHRYFALSGPDVAATLEALRDWSRPCRRSPGGRRRRR
jgi:DNA-binding transcriptional ArsR family regulator